MTQQFNILVVTHNHVSFIDDLISSLEKFEFYNTYFCDACSTDGTLEKISNSRFKDNLLRKQELESFSKNNNDLIRYFKLDSEFYLLLNPDTFFEINFVEELLLVMNNDDTIGITTPILKYPDGRIQKSWKRYPSFKNVVKKRMGLINAEDEIQMEGPRIDWCLGACMMISNRLLKEDSTLLDERYRLYCEDIDICFEAYVRKLKVIGVSTTFIYHFLNEKSSKRIFSKYNLWNVSSIIKFILKWNTRYFLKGHIN